MHIERLLQEVRASSPPADADESVELDEPADEE
jgi:hypothetical protein